MKTDLHTKVVLTVIAIALVCIMIQNFGLSTPVHAVNYSSTGITSTSSYQEVNLRYHGLEEWSALPVYIVEKPKKKENTEE